MDSYIDLSYFSRISHLAYGIKVTLAVGIYLFPGFIDLVLSDDTYKKWRPQLLAKVNTFMDSKQSKVFCKSERGAMTLCVLYKHNLISKDTAINLVSTSYLSALGVYSKFKPFSHHAWVSEDDIDSWRVEKPRRFEFLSLPFEALQTIVFHILENQYRTDWYSVDIVMDVCSIKYPIKEHFFLLYRIFQKHPLKCMNYLTLYAPQFKCIFKDSIQRIDMTKYAHPIYDNSGNYEDYGTYDDSFERFYAKEPYISVILDLLISNRQIVTTERMDK
jgi:hypothetical protein